MYKHPFFGENIPKRGVFFMRVEKIMTKEEYSRLADTKSPNSKTGINLVKAFVSGGLICCVGQALVYAYSRGLQLNEEMTATAVSVTLIFLGVLLTNLKVYDCFAKVSGAGTLVPITGFANSVASPALEFKAEGFVSGLAAKMFVIAGPVIVYGISASVIYGIILWLIKIV